MQQVSTALDFLTKGTDLSKLGFKIQDKKMYESLISPFADDQEKPHPLKQVIPLSFQSFQFSIDKVDKSKLTEQTLIYIFYNIIEEKRQVEAAQLLMSKKINYHKKQRVWVKQAQDGVGYLYFNIIQWKYLEFKGPTDEASFFGLKEFTEKAPVK